MECPELSTGSNVSERSIEGAVASYRGVIEDKKE